MSLYYEDAGLRLWHGRNMDVLPQFADASFDSIVTDPPYELGFMGKGWDSTGIAYDVEVWRECLRVLKPGGYLLAFGGSRTWHRLAAAIEDAGFEIRDSIAWLYGSGFPKSMDVSKAIDKSGGNAHLARPIAAAIRAARIAHGWTIGRADAEFCGGSTLYSWYEGRPKGIQTPTPKTFALMVEAWPELAPYAAAVAEVEREITGSHKSGISVGDSGPSGSGEGKERRDIPATDAAKAWEGWGTALKPAFEPIVVGRKPLAGTVAANVLEHGTGALNIAAARVGVESLPAVRRGMSKLGTFEGADGNETGERVGRWPTNVALDPSQANLLDAQSGLSRSRIGKPRGAASGAGWGMTATGAEYDDEGGASRFFPTFRYEAKAPSSERPEVDGTVHATVKPLELMRWLIRLVTRRGGRVLDLYAGSGTTGEAALLEGMEVDLIEMEDDHIPLILARVRKPLQPSLFGDAA